MLSGRRIRGVLGATAVAIGGLVLATAWFVTSETALRWVASELMARSEGRLVIDGLEGSLGGPMRAKRIRYTTDAIQLTAADVDLVWTPHLLLARELHLVRLAAAAIVIDVGPGTASGPAPHSLALPIAVSIEHAAVGDVELRVGANVWHAGMLEFGYASDAIQHGLTALRAETAWGRLDGAATIGAQPPLAAAGAFVLAGSTELHGAAIAATIGGDLTALQLGVRVDAEGAQAHANALLTPFQATAWRDLSAQVETLDLSRVDPSMPATRLLVMLDAAPAADGSIDGSLTAANALAGALDTGQLPVVQASAKFAVAAERGRLVLTDVDARVGRAGRVTGSGTLTRAGSEWQLAIAALNLRDVVSSLRTTALNGSAQCALGANGQSCRGNVRDRRLALTFAADAQGTDLALRQFRLVAGKGALQGTARFALANDRRFTVTATAARIDPGYFGDFPKGTLSGTLTARGALAPAWSVEARLALAEGSRLRGAPLTGTVAMRVEPERVSGVVVQLNSGNDRLSAQGAFGRPGDILQYRIDAEDLSAVAAVMPGHSLAGRLAVYGSVAGSRTRPAVAFRGTADALRWGSAYRVGHVNADGQIDVRGATDTPLTINVDARGLVLDKVLVDRLALHVDGTPAQHNAQLALRGADFDLHARVSGELFGDERDRRWQGRIIALDNAGRYPLALTAPAEFFWHGSRFELADVRGSLAGGTFALHDVSWDSGRLSSSGEFSGLPVAPILATTGIGERVHSTLTVDGRWSFSAAPQLDGSLSVTRAAGDLVAVDSPELGLNLSRLELVAHSVGGHVEVSAAAQSRFGELEASARFIAAPRIAEFIDRGAPLALDLHLDAKSLRPLQSFLGTNALIDGRLQADLSGTGTVDQVRLSGSVNADELRVSAPQYGMAVRDGVLRARLVDGGLILDRLSLKGGDGSFEASGTLPRNDGNTTQASLHWSADHLRLLNRPDVRLVLSGQGNFDLADGRVRLEGELVSDEGFYEFRGSRPGTLGDDVVVRGREPRAAKASALKLPLAVDLVLDFGKRFTFVGNGLDVVLAGRVRITTDGTVPLAAKGTIDATRGSYTAFGQRLDIVRGRLIFDGPLADPALDLLALRRNLAVEAGVAVTGTVSVPRVQLTSNPPVPDNEKLSWLLLGRGTASGSGADQAALQLAMATLSGGGASLPQRFARSVGLDDINVRSADARGTGAAGQVVAATTRLTDSITLVYEQGLSLVNTAARLEYALTPRITLRAEAGVVTGFGIYYSRSFD
jgi:translocation and assembly module TamB